MLTYIVVCLKTINKSTNKLYVKKQQLYKYLNICVSVYIPRDMN